MQPSTKALHAWAAGILDGEGTIYIGRTKRPYGWAHLLVCSVAQSGPEQPEMLTRLFDLFGGSIHVDKGYGNARAPAWRWAVYSARAEATIRAVLPYLTTKREQAKIAIEYRENAVGRGRTEGAAAYRERLMEIRRASLHWDPARPPHPRRGPRKKMTDEQVREAYDRYLAGNASCTELASSYGVSDSLIHAIISGRARRAVTGLPRPPGSL